MLTTFTLENAMHLGASHMESLVDERGRTYFNIFRTQPAEAVFDWPDFVDLPARYIEAAVMIQPILDRPVSTLPLLQQWLYSHVEENGLAYRPEGPISNHWAELFDQSRYLYMLCSLAMNNPSDAVIRKRLQSACNGLYAQATFNEDWAYIERIEVYFGGTLIRPMVQAGLILNESKWIDFAGKLVRAILYHSDHYAQDGSFKGHHHGHLSTQAGMLAYSHVTGDTEMRDRARQLFDWSRSISASSGFVPEVAQRQDDIQVCETCTLMDYLDTALLLARHVDASYWNVVEKATRNHLVEAQVRDANWLVEDANAQDEEDIIRSNIRHRVLGSFAGWAAPHAQLGVAEEQQQYTWVKSPEMRPRYWHKVRAIQNCCAGAGIRALHQVWSNIAMYNDHCLTVGMLMDKEIPEARITNYAPYSGRAHIDVRSNCKVRFRVSSEIQTSDVEANIAGQPVKLVEDNGFLVVNNMTAGERLEISYPLIKRTETFSIGNAGFQKYNFTAEWLGDTIVEMTPDPSNAEMGMSHVFHKQIPVYYREDAPGRMYLDRKSSLSVEEIKPSKTTVDKTAIDWYCLT